MKERNWKYLVAAVVLLMAIGAGVLDYFRPVFGDDLSFWAFLGRENYVVPNRRTISFILAHIEGCNGRLFDYMGPIVVDLLPRWLQAVLMGGMTGLFFFAMLLSTRHRGSAAVLFLAIILAVMPWWDGMLMHVCQFNYPWGTTFCLLFLWFFFHGKERYGRWTLAGITLLALFAGATHEQTGVAMSAAMLLYAAIGKRYKQFTKPQRWLMAGLLFGAFLTVAAPAIWHRAAQDSFHWPGWKLAITTLPIYMILLVVMAIRNKRLKFSPEDRTMFIAASVAAVIAIASGIPGRTGWFSEAISLVLLARMVPARHWVAGLEACSTVLAICFIAAHYAVAIKYQARAYDEHLEMQRQFIESEDGVVYMDYQQRYDVPWITLYRVRGVYPPYDTWSATVLSRTYADGIKRPLVLPAAFKGLEITDSLTIGDVTIYKPQAPNVLVTQDSTLVQPWQGQIRIVRQGPGFEAAIACKQEPGDMLPPIKR